MQLVHPFDIEWQDTGHGYFRKILMMVNNTEGKTCKVQFCKIPPNSTVKPHCHKGQTELEYVFSGSGTIKSGEKTIKLKPGIIFIVEPNEVHEVKSGKKGLLLFVTKANFSDATEWFEKE